MAYTVNRVEQLVDANKKSYSSLARQLRAAGTPSKQHNVDVKTKASAKKTAAAKPAKKATAKKTSAAKKSAAKKTTAKKS